MSPSDFDFPPPKTEQKFEDFCLDLWREIWRDDSINKVGTRGSSQDGLDIYGREQSTGEYIGIQCTITKNASKLLAKFKSDVELAKQFTPPIKKFIFAYTGKNNKTLQEEARKITVENETKGLFSVEVASWETICLHLNRYQQAARIHLNMNIPCNFDTTDKMLREILAAVTSKPITSLNSITNENEQDNLLIPARTLMQEGLYNKALSNLIEIKNKNWITVSNKIKYKILTNIGVCHHEMDNYAAAASAFIEAYSYNSHEIAAKTNYANGLFLSDQLASAKKIASEVLKIEPNIAACQILLSINGEHQTIKHLENIVPKELRSESEILYSLGALAYMKSEHDKAINYLERSVKKKERADALGLLGSIILEQQIESKKIIYRDQMSNKLIEQLRLASSFLERAWNLVKNTDQKTTKLMWCFNLAQCYRFMQEPQKAIAIIHNGITIDPQNQTLIKLLIINYFEQDNFRDALDKLNRSSNALDLELIELKIQCLCNLQSKNKALEFINEQIQIHNKDYTNLVLKKIELLVSIDPEKAKSLIASTKKQNINNVALMILSVKADILLDLNDKALKTLSKIKGVNVNELTPNQINDIADLFYRMNEFDSASKYYEMLADLTTENILSRRLVDSYFRADKLELSLDAAQAIEKSAGSSLFTTEIQFRIYDSIGDLNSAIMVCDRHLKNNSSIRIQMMKAGALIRQGKKEEAKKYIDKNWDISTFNLSEIMIFSDILIVFGLNQKAIEVVYAARERFYNEPSVHLKYIGLILERSESLNEWLYPSRVTIDTIVSFQAKNGEVKTIQIVSAAHQNLPEFKFSEAHPYSKALLNHKVGDNIIISNPLDQQCYYKITEIKSKYINALHETIDKFNDLFPEHRGMIKCDLPTNNEDGSNTTLSHMEEIIDSLDPNSNRNEVLDAYKKNEVPLGVIAKRFGLNPIIAFGNVIGADDIGPINAIGSHEEREKALSDLKNNHKPLLVDVTSILSIFYLKIQKIICQQFKKIYVTQSTIDDFNNLILNTQTNKNKFGIIGKTEHGVFIRETTIEEQIQHLEHLKEILEWIKNNCQITPVYERLKSNPKEYNTLSNVLSVSIADTVLVAKSGEYLYYCDDLFTRKVVQDIFYQPTVWTQTILIHAQNNHALKLEEYCDFIISLTLAGYNFISLNERILLRVLEKDFYRNTPSFSKVCKAMFVETVDQMGVDIILGLLLSNLWKLNLGISTHKRLTNMILGFILFNADSDKNLQRILNVLTFAVFDNPYKRSIIASFHEWREGHFIESETFLNIIRGCTS